MSLRDDLIARGFIIPNPTTDPTPPEPLNGYQRETLTLRTFGPDDSPSAWSHFTDVYEDRFSGPVVVYSRDGEREGPNGERWQLPPLKNQWSHDWRRRVEAGQPTTHLRAPRWAYYGGE
jgi:hypothetical protein